MKTEGVRSIAPPWDESSTPPPPLWWWEGLFTFMAWITAVCTEPALAMATFRVNMAKTDNATSRVRRMVPLPPAVMAPPRRSGVVIDVGGLDVKHSGRRLVKTSTLYSGPAE